MFYFIKNLYISDTSKRLLQIVYLCLNSRKFLLKNNTDATSEYLKGLTIDAEWFWVLTLLKTQVYTMYVNRNIKILQF